MSLIIKRTRQHHASPEGNFKTDTTDFLDLKLQSDGFAGRSNQLLRFLLLSMALHLCAMGIYFKWTKTQPQSTPYILHVQMTQATESTNSFTRRPISKENHKPGSPSTSSDKTSPRQSIAEARSDWTKSSPQRRAKSANHTHRASAWVQSEIRKALPIFFTYPKIAQRKGWQGTVLLQLSIDPNGIFSAVEVLQTSGYRALDSAAVQSLIRLGSIPELSQFSLPKNLQVKVPVRFQLIDS